MLSKLRFLNIISFFISTLSLLFAISVSASTDSTYKVEYYKPNAALKLRFANIPVLILQGPHKQMGIQYGKAMQYELQQSLDLFKNFYITEYHVPYEKIKDKADNFYERFPISFQLFIQGIAIGSKINLEDIKILNALETLTPLLPDDADDHCSFIALPPQKTTTATTLIGRNYDFWPLSSKIAPYLTVTILKEDNTIPTAFISMPGQIYCPSCINANGLFMELNSGSSSGGHYHEENRQSLLINMLQSMQNSANLQQLEKQLNATQSDYSLIVNITDKNLIKSFEFSSTLGMKNMVPQKNNTFVSTNFYLNNTWQNIPKPTDQNAWMAVTRRNNLLKLAQEKNIFNIDEFKSLMDKKIENGGAVWHATIYQMIFDPKDMALYLKINGQSPSWTKIPLEKLFAEKIGKAMATAQQPKAN